MEKNNRLEELRNQIDCLDGQITALFCERMRICAEISRVKRSMSAKIEDAARESEVINRARSAAQSGMEDYTAELFSEIMNLSKRYQTVLTEERKPGGGRRSGL